MASTNGVFSGKVILPLLALGGVVSWIRWKIRQVHAAKEDYLSQLPDAVLSTILGHLTVKDATRTSILSRRWRYLFTSMPKLRFRCLQMFGVLSHDHCSCPYYQEKFVKGVNQLLELYSGRTVAHIEMYFCLWKEFSNEFEQWMHSISRLGVEKLYLYFGCGGAIFPTQDFSKFPTFPLDLLSQASSLKHLHLYHCFVQPSSIVCFNSLVNLTLMGVLLASGQLEGILSSCLNLKILFLEVCQLHYKLRLASSTVTSVVFLSCYGVVQIDLQAANLRRLDCYICNEVRFFFSYVPMLEYVSVHPWGAASMSYIFGDFARDLPAQVKYLAVKVDHFEVNCFPTEMKMFRNLRELSLALVNMSDFFDIVKLLCACPLLQYLTLVTITKAGPIRDERRSTRPYLSPTCHTKLKEVSFGGFHGTESEIEFALCILRSAIVLEKMILSPFYRCRFGYAWKDNLDESFDERELNSIQQKLFGQAISCKAEVIIY